MYPYRRWSPDGVPVIVSQPPVTGCVSGTVVIESIPASGYDFDGSVTYFWRHAVPNTTIDVTVQEGAQGTLIGAGGGTVIGAATPLLTIQGFSAPDVGVYTLHAVNACGETVGINTILSLSCPADINHSCAVEVQDIFDFLALWFNQDPLADFNQRDGVTVQDIFDFLDAWFTGC